MSQVGIVIFIALRIYILMLIARLITEMIQSFSKEFRPPSWFVRVVEPIFMVTDPPVKLLRRLIPSLPLGGVRLDISVIVLFFLLSILQQFVLHATMAAA